MGLVVADRVQETTTTVGTGAVTLAGAVAGYQAFEDVCTDGDEVFYCIAHRTPGQWEVGIGTFTAGVLSRDTMLSSSTGSIVAFAAGTKDVFLTQPADRISALPLRRLDGTLTSAQILQLFTTPVQVLSDVAGVTIIPKYLYVRKPAGTPYTLNGSASLRVNFGAAAGGLSCFQVSSVGIFDQPGESKAMWFGVSGGVMNVGLGGVNSVSGLGLRWTVPTANWTNGDSDIIWQLYYRRLTET